MIYFSEVCTGGKSDGNVGLEMHMQNGLASLTEPERGQTGLPGQAGRLTAGATLRAVRQPPVASRDTYNVPMT